MDLCATKWIYTPTRVSGQGSLELALIMKTKKGRLIIGYFSNMWFCLSLTLVVYRLLQINFRVLHFGISLFLIIQ